VCDGGVYAWTEQVHDEVVRGVCGWNWKMAGVLVFVQIVYTTVMKICGLYLNLFDAKKAYTIFGKKKQHRDFIVAPNVPKAL